MGQKTGGKEGGVGGVGCKHQLNTKGRTMKAAKYNPLYNINSSSGSQISTSPRGTGRLSHKHCRTKPSTLIFFKSHKAPSYHSINGVVVTWVVATSRDCLDPPGVRFPLNASAFWCFFSLSAAIRFRQSII